MDTRVPHAEFLSGHYIILEIQDSQIHVAVAEIVSNGVRALHLADFLQVEHRLEEFGGLVRLLARNCNMLDLCHFPSSR